jgi:hypothetical protein
MTTIADLDTDVRAAIADALIPEGRGIDRFLYIWMGRDDKLLTYLPSTLSDESELRSCRIEPAGADASFDSPEAQVLPFEPVKR